jgi:hypothetical protein
LKVNISVLYFTSAIVGDAQWRRFYFGSNGGRIAIGELDTSKQSPELAVTSFLSPRGNL